LKTNFITEGKDLKCWCCRHCVSVNDVTEWRVSVCALVDVLFEVAVPNMTTCHQVPECIQSQSQPHYDICIAAAYNTGQ